MDTHVDQNQFHAPLFIELNQAMAAFYKATVELGLSDRITTFTASDFGRSQAENVVLGTDHGWGSHHMVMGGAVRGQRIFGRYPVLALGGPDDTSDGRWIPTISVDDTSRPWRNGSASAGRTCRWSSPIRPLRHS